MGYDIFYYNSPDCTGPIVGTCAAIAPGICCNVASYGDLDPNIYSVYMSCVPGDSWNVSPLIDGTLTDCLDPFAFTGAGPGCVSAGQTNTRGYPIAAAQYAG